MRHLWPEIRLAERSQSAHETAHWRETDTVHDMQRAFCAKRAVKESHAQISQ